MEERARWLWTKTRRVLVNAQVRPVQLWRVTNNLPDHSASRGSRAHGYLWQVMYCRPRLWKYYFLSHKKGFLCEMRQIHFDINFGNFCCRIKNSFEKSERDPHLGKQLSYSDINTIFNSFCFNTNSVLVCRHGRFKSAVCRVRAAPARRGRWNTRSSRSLFLFHAHSWMVVDGQLTVKIVWVSK